MQLVPLAAWEMPCSVTTLVWHLYSISKKAADLIGIMSGLLVNEIFIARFFKDYGGADGTTSGVNPSITGISVACLQAAAAVRALIAGRLGDMIGRKKCVRVGAFIYFFSSFIQIFAPGFATLITGRTI
jgi:MFS family permease